MDKEREQRIIEMMRGDEELGLYQDQELNELGSYILNWTSWVLMNTHAEVGGLSYPKDNPWWILKMYEKWKKNSDFGQKYELEIKNSDIYNKK
jgi:hypothetical protein